MAADLRCRRWRHLPKAVAAPQATHGLIQWTLFPSLAPTHLLPSFAIMPWAPEVSIASGAVQAVDGGVVGARNELVRARSRVPRESYTP